MSSPLSRTITVVLLGLGCLPARSAPPAALDEARLAVRVDEAHESKPENLAAATARLFLGVKLECAQCHDDRSGGHWAREQFWELAAFFGGSRHLDIPGTKRRVEARFLDGKKPTDAEINAAGLASWVTSPKNHYFARATANRVWGYLFGAGLVDPV